MGRRDKDWRFGQDVLSCNAGHLRARVMGYGERNARPGERLRDRRAGLFLTY
jgi:hypothetical protein